VFLRIKTVRYKEHVGPGEDFAAGYRSEAEVKNWKSHDPLFEDSERFTGYRQRITEEINKALIILITKK
jgi:pyruvate dehydrogenase E1 component alpha subunit